MDYHNPHSDLFQMATEPWCDDYVAQYGNSIQYPVTNSFAYNLPYDDLTQHHNHNQHQQQLLYSSVQVPYEDVYLDTSSSAAASDYLLTQPYMEAVTSATTSPSDYDTPHNASSSASSSVSVASRKQPESRMSQPELFSRMGLSHDPEEARNRENRVLSLLKSRGFKLGEQTWIRDTTPAVRQEIVDFIHASTVQEYGYSKYMIEVVIRRACYHLMQGRLRRIRRARKSKGN
ncbi:hypothetical protein B0I72DRAFT_164303 [Yarrowia lipolytica]|uniref:YALI0C15576p n=2 Tax=Yarrowia lipolytica TaxID=4952 RepID=Q6CBT8_YARLI|nr:YALI0C15576p [Yarrowia lipolytica CLIB122]KAB8280412.1 hypothetical protein BKA91DRAFT_164196 [Yarrowia lipolytica]KAE8169499.1 hypothetical protein BKA90DRAFT_159264 [Yarrowia lipolytica]KAJ8053496.1 hypothetical protein LXG23DRAFT_23795 [Yarrowia lipolytica]RDW26098.1 hypothetical protein B0I71DRAFT_170637 [Yarrowia lipolytica]RDW33066.1 hypothetical protein B0I72DRAFT_164303 [Yarrowia lipolytica]|eukprot:XP_501874.2 YALI0C15576p [Yarrowia lipolytica CLIB122]